MRPVALPAYLKHILKLTDEEKINLVKQNYPRLHKNGLPTVSIVVPAYNEERNILNVLVSLSNNLSDRNVEIIVVNNSGGVACAIYRNI